MGCVYASSSYLVHDYELLSDLELLNNKDNSSKETFLKENNSRNKFSMAERSQTHQMRHFSTNSNLTKFKFALKKSSTLEIKKDRDICYSKRILKRLSQEKFNELFDENNFDCFVNMTANKNLKHISYVSRFNNFWNKSNLSLSLNSTNEHTLENKVENNKYNTSIKSMEKRLKDKILSIKQKDKMSQSFVKDKIRIKGYNNDESMIKKSFNYFVNKSLLNYKDNTAGSVMTTEYIEMKNTTSVGDAIKQIRKNGRDAETIYTIFVRDSQRTMVGTVDLDDLIFSEEDKTLEDIMNRDFVTCNVNDDQEAVANMFSRYDLTAMAVLNKDNKKMFMIPRGFAHGFVVLSEEAEFTYKCDEIYHPEDEGGIMWNDPEIGITWPYEGEPLLSEKDKKHPSLKESKMEFVL